jgi:hypothetical protein
MKRMLRFIKWFINKSTWFDFVLFTTCFTLSFGFFAGEGSSRDIAWTIAIVINVIFAFGFMIQGAKNIWQDFKKHDEKVFDILKKEKIDGR